MAAAVAYTTGRQTAGRADALMEHIPPTDELVKRLRQQALLAEIGRRALADSNLDSLLTEAARLCAFGLEVRYCKVLEYLPDENRLLVRAGVGWHEGVVGHAILSPELLQPPNSRLLECASV